jgi:hypothetical protein
MRTLSIAWSSLAVLALAGCPPVCPEPAAVDGSWSVFATVLDIEGDEPDFPSYQTPANGASNWVLEWGAAADGPVGVQVDGQTLDASGVWSTRACGTFALDLSGVYTSATGSTHDLDAQAEWVVWQDQLDGTWDWAEDWTDRDGVASGRFSARGQVEGSRGN